MNEAKQPQAEDSPAPNRDGIVSKAPSTKSKVFSRYQLPSDRTPFSTHFDILSRFVTQSRYGAEAIGAEKVEGEGIPIQAAQMNVKFLTSVNLLKFDSKGLYLPSPETIRFINAKTVSDDRARPLLRSLIRPTWFAEIAVSVLRMRPIVTDDALIGELALAAETNKEKKGPALRVLVEYLVWSGVLSRDERGLAIGEADAETPGVATPGSEAPVSSDSPSGIGPARRSGVSPPGPSEAGAWHIVQTEDFFLKVRSDPEIVEDVREQLSFLSKKIQRIRAKAAPADSGTGSHGSTSPEPAS